MKDLPKKIKTSVGRIILCLSVTWAYMKLQEDTRGSHRQQWRRCGQGCFARACNKRNRSHTQQHTTRTTPQTNNHTNKPLTPLNNARRWREKNKIKRKRKLTVGRPYGLMLSVKWAYMIQEDTRRPPSAVALRRQGCFARACRERKENKNTKSTVGSAVFFAVCN